MKSYVKILALSLIAFGCGGGDATDEDPNSFAVTASGSTNYTIDGDADPTLTLKRGETYTFEVSASGHPFYIMAVQGTNTANAYDDGVTNNGVQTGTLTFVVPADAPDELFYNCSLHAPMTGTIEITD